MDSIYVAAIFALLVSMLIALSRALLGPTLFDRILTINMLGTKFIMLIAVFAFLSGRSDVLDIALLYALLNFIGVVAALRLVQRGTFFAHTDGVHKSEATEKTQQDGGEQP